MAQKRPSGGADSQLPWKKMLIVTAMVFLTGLMALFQQYSSFISGNIFGTNQGVLSDYNCPDSSQAFEVSPVPQLISYQKGNTDANRLEFLRINKKNHGLTTWYTYDMGFNESLKASLIDFIASTKDPNQYLVKVYNSIANHNSPHGAMDLVTKWLSPDNINLPTVYPYANGYVVEATSSSGGYGNYVSVCTDVALKSGKQLRVLYTVGHMKTLNVQAGQMIQAGTQLGTIGSTGSSTTPHAHIAIMPDLVWTPNYREVYNAGYKSFFPTSVRAVLAKTIDPVTVMLNPDIAYSLVENASKQQAFFEGASTYIASLSGIASLNPEDLIGDQGGASVISSKVFSDFKILVNQETAVKGKQIDVTIEAVDQEGNYYPDFEQSIKLVLSSPTAQVSGVGQMKQGRTSFQLTDSNPGEVVIQVSNSGSISEEKKVVFTDELKFLEVTAPQKTTVGRQVAIGVRPIGTQGGILDQSLLASVQVFPTAGAQQASIVIDEGRGEYLFEASQEGIYQVSFQVGAVQETIQVTVQNLVIPGADDNEESPEEEMVEETVETPEETPEEESVDSSEESSVDTPEEVPEEQPSVEETDVVQEEPEENSTDVSEVPVGAGIQFLEGENYVLHQVSGSTLIVFNDADVNGQEYPVEMRFTVPEGTQTVSIFTGLNDRNFPATGELKLSKYTPGQEFIRYYPKYVPEDTYKKVVAYDAQGREIVSEVFTWSPASLHLFTDVINGLVDADIYEAVALLKSAGVVKGNPDGTFGLETPINRAAAATLLIRAFYSDVNLESLSVSSTGFSDVPAGAWYESAIWFASEDSYEGQSKPVLIKGYQGKANPDGNVKLEEMLTMILRLLEVPLPETTPWYDSALEASEDLDLISSSERSLLDKPLSRGMVARMLVRALELLEEDELEDYRELMQQAIESAASTSEETEESMEEEEVSVEESSPVAEENSADISGASVSATDLNYSYSADGVTISWKTDQAGPFRIFRQKPKGAEVEIGSSQGKAFTDVSAHDGEQYYYRVLADGEGMQKAEIFVDLQ